MSYERITADHPAYDTVQARIAAGVDVCDAVDHNEPDGCSNPNCWNHESRLYRTTLFRAQDNSVRRWTRHRVHSSRQRTACGLWVPATATLHYRYHKPTNILRLDVCQRCFKESR